MTHSLISRFTKTQLGQAVLLTILVVIGTGVMRNPKFGFMRGKTRFFGGGTLD